MIAHRTRHALHSAAHVLEVDMADSPYGPLAHHAPNRHRMPRRCKREELLDVDRFDFVATNRRATISAMLEKSTFTILDVDPCTRIPKKTDDSPA